MGLQPFCNLVKKERRCFLSVIFGLFEHYKSNVTKLFY